MLEPSIIPGIEGCAEEDPVNFQTLAEDALDEVPQRLQVKDIPCHRNEMLGQLAWVKMVKAIGKNMEKNPTTDSDQV